MADDLAREASVFARYLTGHAVHTYVAERYAAGQAALPRHRSALDETLVRVARVHPLLTRAADACGCVLAPRSALRQKLVLLTAVLESSHPTNRGFDPVPVTVPGGMLRLAAAGAGFACALALGLLVVPLWHAAALAGGRR